MESHMGPKVLIVEDERVIAEHLQEMLDSFGYEVIGIVATGDRAIEIAKKNRPDVVLMDIPINASLNGVETAVCLQGIYEDPGSNPIRNSIFR
jgi:CheY-like chemotaxis protein